MNDLAEERVGKPIRFEVSMDYAEGERLDVFLADRISGTSRSKIQRSIKEGLVSVNDEPVKKSYPVEPGDRIEFRLLKPPPLGAEPEPIPLDIVYEDEHLIVVDKPAGMVVHPGYGNRTGTLVNALLHHVKGDPILVEDLDDEDLDDDEVGLSTLNALPAQEGNPAIRPGIVHRLDKDTSGLLVVAKHDVAHRGLARQFAEHATQREYVALVWGHPEPRSGRIEGAIGRNPRDRKRMAVVSEEKGKHAVTHYDTEERQAHTARLCLQLETGRTHQIRVHLQHIGHPVLGDPDYGGQSIRMGPNTKSRRAFFRNLFDRMSRQALHARMLGFIHPVTEETLRFEAPLPEDMQHVLERLRRAEPGSTAS